MADLEKFLEFQYKIIDVPDCRDAQMKMSAKLPHIPQQERRGVLELVQDVISGRIFRKRMVTHEEGRMCSVLQNIHHPNLVNIEAVYYLEHAAVVIEEYVNGYSMRQLLEQNGTLTEEMSERYIRQICSALRELHARNMVHRNLTPDNIIVTTDGIIKVTNPGAMRVIDRNKMCDTIFMGTSGYAAPEQFGFGQSDNRTDIYAVGVLLNVMLTGHVPAEVLYSGKRTFKTIIKKLPFRKSVPTAY